MLLGAQNESITLTLKKEAFERFHSTYLNLLLNQVLLVSLFLYLEFGRHIQEKGEKVKDRPKNNN